MFFFLRILLIFFTEGFCWSYTTKQNFTLSLKPLESFGAPDNVAVSTLLHIIWIYSILLHKRYALIFLSWRECEIPHFGGGY